MITTLIRGSRAKLPNKPKHFWFSGTKPTPVRTRLGIVRRLCSPFCCATDNVHLAIVGIDYKESVRATPPATRTFERWGTIPALLVHTRQHRELTGNGGAQSAVPFAHAHTRELNARHKSVDLRAKIEMPALG
jgi:hypothetical protein